jgi:hypothetical protein
VTAVALKTCEAAAPDATIEEPAKLLLEECGQSVGIGASGGREKRFQMFADDLMEHGAFGLAGPIAH